MFQRELTWRQLLKSAAAGTAASLLGLPRQKALAADATGSMGIWERSPESSIVRLSRGLVLAPARRTRSVQWYLTNRAIP
jgi:hypothetical protein